MCVRSKPELARQTVSERFDASVLSMPASYRCVAAIFEESAGCCACNVARHLLAADFLVDLAQRVLTVRLQCCEVVWTAGACVEHTLSSSCFCTNHARSSVYYP